mgnify:FL=1
MPSGIASKIRHVLPKNILAKLPQEIGVVLINTHTSQKLNLIYRGKNKPTNVLSFFYNYEYGEILICPEIVKKEAKKQGNSQEYQMTWMVLHGMLHLAGVHHEQSRVQARRFFELEKKILIKFFKKI